MTRINATLNNTHKRLQSGLPSLRPPPLRPAREAFKHMYPFVSAYKLKRTILPILRVVSIFIW